MFKELVSQNNDERLELKLIIEGQAKEINRLLISNIDIDKFKSENCDLLKLQETLQVQIAALKSPPNRVMGTGRSEILGLKSDVSLL